MGSVVISLDAELGWGLHHHDEMPVSRVQSARDAWRRLCETFDEFEIPATWAVVGHLFLDDCDESHADHPAGPRVCASPPDVADDAWFGGDLIDRVTDADVDHDVGLHGFTHVHYRHDCMSRSFAARELRRGREAAEARGISPTSFVYPVNLIEDLDLLAEHGFDSYRGRQPTRRGSTQKFADALLDRGAPPIVSPEIDQHGLVNVPASLYLFGFEGHGRTLVEGVRGDPVVGWAERGMERLGDEEGVLHLWLHPNNLTRERDFERMRAVLAHVARLRDRGTIDVETMDDVATRVTERGG